MMPLFRSKFQPKKSPPRKAGTVSNLQRSLDAAQIEQEFAIQFDQIKLDLGGQHQFVFDSRGQWLATGRNRSRSNSANSSSSHNVDRLAGQNQMLHIQVELLLNMLAETALEAHLKNYAKAEETARKNPKRPK